jgi:pimeloyl-ACP methyl ester carboxylesterase
MHEISRAPIEAKRGWLQVKPGELSFECAGEGDAVAFLHGFGLDLRMWASQFEAFQVTASDAQRLITESQVLDKQQCAGAEGQ